MGDNNELRMRESVTLEEESKREMQLNEDKEEMIEMVNSEKKLTELLTSINSILKQHESRIERLEEDNKLKSLMYQKLDSSYRSVQLENRQLREQLRRQGLRVAGIMGGVERGQKRLEELNRRTLAEIETNVRRKKIHPGEASIFNLVNGVEWRIDEMHSLLDSKEDLWGPCFYIGDYKFQVNIAANDERGYLAFYVALIKGLYDEELEWPFRGELVYLLSNQENEGEFFRKEFVITNRQANENFIKPNEMRNTAIGFSKFIRIERLKEARYSKDDSIKLTLLINPVDKY
eukprot:TRINITY_DN22032_c0_g1_i1.p1 TRINITY_DN22032_c0_g1~~TRINITY_DN22032_c0_g1_i1.p1  ORF type:complete len:290 (-),score=76.73 TRINITY_DN22032_c0_g1_i1:26-895(-)